MVYIQRTTRMLLQHLSLLLICVSALAVAAPAVQIAPPSTSAVNGASFDVDVTISDVSDLYAFQFDLAFDPLVLNAISSSEGAFLPSAGSTLFLSGSIDNTAGTISFIADILLAAIPGASGSGVLATITFDAVDVGTSALTLSNLVFLDSNLNDVADITTQGGSANVSSDGVVVPEPATWTIVGLALGGLVAIRRRRRA